MRIVHVIPGLDPRSGGPFTALMALARAQAARRHRVTVVCTYRGNYPEGPAGELRRSGIDVQLIGPVVSPLEWHWQIPRTLRQTIRGASIVHIHALWEEIQHRGARIAHELGVPYIITAHGMLDPWSLSQRSLKKRLYMAMRLRGNLDRAAAVHFTTDIERDLTAPLNLRAPSIVEPYCIDLSEFRSLPERGFLRARFPQIGDRKIALFFGRIHPKKGLDLLLPAFAKAKRSDSVLVLAGPVARDYQSRLETMIRTNDLGDRIYMPGMLFGEDRVAALRDADLFVLPSYQENFGIAVVEAMACATPVIISDQVNIHPQITASHGGAVIPTEVGALTEKLVRWLGDDSLRHSAGERARDFVMCEYDPRQSVQRWTDHYAHAISIAAAREPAPLQPSYAPEGFISSATTGAARPSIGALARSHAG